jgi:hypothetical protein
MKMTIQRITPSIASEMLKRNANPRPLTASGVAYFKATFERNEYVLSHQGIAFVGDKLTDGQHRLTAISQMPEGFSVEMLVCHDVDPRAIRVMDIGKRRTAANVLGEGNAITETARVLAVIYLGKASTITPTYLAPFVEAIRAPHEDLLSFCPTRCKMWSSAPVRAAVMVIALEDGDLDYAKLVYHAMVTKNFPTMPRVAQAVLKAQLEGKVRAAHRLDTIARGLKIFDPKYADLKKVQVNDTAHVVQQIRSLLRRLLSLNGGSK